MLDARLPCRRNFWQYSKEVSRHETCCLMACERTHTRPVRVAGQNGRTKRRARTVGLEIAERCISLVVLEDLLQTYPLCLSLHRKLLTADSGLRAAEQGYHGLAQHVRHVRHERHCSERMRAQPKDNQHSTASWRMRRALHVPCPPRAVALCRHPRMG